LDAFQANPTKLIHMITYAQVKKAMINPPPEPLVSIFNDLGVWISQHPYCINDKNPFEKLAQKGSFCISATSIQSNYIAFVLGKHNVSEFPVEVMNLFYDIDPKFAMQYGKIKGKEIDGCIYLIHQGDTKYDLQEVYQKIYA